MIRGAKCPTRDVLDKIVAGGKPSFMVRRHLGHCAACKEKLAELADFRSMAVDLREAERCKPDAAQQERLQTLLDQLAPEFATIHSAPHPDN